MSVKKTLILALLIRLIIIPAFYHPDIKSQYFHFQFLSQGITDIYSYIQNRRQNLPYTDTFNYLPLTYFAFGSYYFLIKSPLLESWLNDWGPFKDANPHLPLFLFILKLPYLFLDFALACLLLKTSHRLFSLWLLNPFTLYLIYVLGNFDILPVFLMVLSLYLIQRNRLYLAFFIYGLAIALKLYPLIFLPFFLFLSSASLSAKIKHLLIALLPLVVTTTPFLVNPTFITSFQSSGLSQKILQTKLWHLPIFPLIYLIIFTIFLVKPSKNLGFFLPLFLFFVSLVNFHPQWLLWFFPFLFLPNIRLSVFIPLTICLFFTFLLNDNYLFWGHLIPIDSNFVNLSSPYLILSQRISPTAPLRLQNFLKTILFLLGLWQLKKYSSQ